MDVSSTTEISASPAKMMLMAGGGVLMTVLSALIAFHVIGDFEHGGFEEFAGYVGLGFFALCTALIVWRAATMRGVVVTLTPEGLRDIRVAPEIIPWTAIRNVSTWSSRRQRILILDVDPQTERQLSLSRIARWTREGNKRLGADGLCVIPQGLTVGYDKLLEMVETYWQAWRGEPQEVVPPPTSDLALFLERYEEIPVSDAVEAVVAELNRYAFVVPLAVAPGEDGSMQLLVGTDNRNLSWAYLYENEAMLADAVAQGTPFVTMPFADLFAMVSGNPAFGGINVHAGSQIYSLPVDYFDRARAVIDTGT